MIGDLESWNEKSDRENQCKVDVNERVANLIISFHITSKIIINRNKINIKNQEIENKIMIEC